MRVGRPKVRVPVLSKATALTLASASMVAPFLTRLPRRAALPMEATSAVGAPSLTHMRSAKQSANRQVPSERVNSE